MPEIIKKLKDKVAIVTGASKGIGAAISKGLAAEGASLVVNYSSSRDAAERVVADITAGGGKAIAVEADVAKSKDIDRLFAEAKASFGALDILVNNAGMYAAAPVGSITRRRLPQAF
jgi:3-oxoacyl-[acyl-carrier protein] reductase